MTTLTAWAEDTRCTDCGHLTELCPCPHYCTPEEHSPMTETVSHAATNWPWHLKITYTDGSVREDDYAAGFDPAGFAQHLSGKPNVERVELATVFARGQQVSPAAAA